MLRILPTYIITKLMYSRAKFNFSKVAILSWHFISSCRRSWQQLNMRYYTDISQWYKQGFYSVAVRSWQLSDVLTVCAVDSLSSRWWLTVSHLLIIFLFLFLFYLSYPVSESLSYTSISFSLYLTLSLSEPYLLLTVLPLPPPFFSSISLLSSLRLSFLQSILDTSQLL